MYIINIIEKEIILNNYNTLSKVSINNTIRFLIDRLSYKAP